MHIPHVTEQLRMPRLKLNVNYLFMTSDPVFELDVYM